MLHVRRISWWWRIVVRAVQTSISRAESVYKSTCQATDREHIAADGSPLVRMADLTLTLTPNNPCDTRITSPTGDLLYSTTTENDKAQSKTVTWLKNANDVTIASLEWGVGASDRVTLGEARQKTMVDWLKKSSNPLSQYAFIVRIN